MSDASLSFRKANSIFRSTLTFVTFSLKVLNTFELVGIRVARIHRKLEGEEALEHTTQ